MATTKAKTKAKAKPKAKSQDATIVVGEEDGKVIRANDLAPMMEKGFATPDTKKATNARLEKVESELIESLTRDRGGWVRQYRLMAKLQNDKSYFENTEYKSFTAWINAFSMKIGIQKSLLWRRLKCGRYYERFLKRNEQAPSLEEAHVSAEKLETILSLTGDKQEQLGDEVVFDAINGKLDANRLKTLAATAKARRDAVAAENKVRRLGSGASRDNVQSVEVNDNDRKEMRANRMVAALIGSHFCLGLPHPPISGNSERFKVRMIHVPLTEFAIQSGVDRHAQRIDLVIIENYTATMREDVTIHGIEVKVNVYDLRNDTKKEDYLPYIDRGWLAVPSGDEKIEQELTEHAANYAFWGILEVNEADGTVAIKKQAPTDVPNIGSNRVDALSQALIYIGSPLLVPKQSADGGGVTPEQNDDGGDQTPPS